MTYTRPKRYETFEFLEEGAEEAVSIRLQCSLTGHELRALEDVSASEGNRLITAPQLYPRIAPHIDAWSLKGYRDGGDKLVAIPPPTVDEHDQLDQLPDAAVWAIFRRLQSSAGRRLEKQEGNSGPLPTGPSGSGVTS